LTMDHRFTEIGDVADALPDEVSLIDSDDDSEIDEDEVLDRWRKAISDKAKADITAADVKRYNAFKYVQLFTPNGLLRDRMDFGNARALREMRKKEWTINHLADAHDILINSEYAEVEMHDWIGEIITFIVDDFMEDIPGSLRDTVKK
jgi:hypothetical protein